MDITKLKGIGDGTAKKFEKNGITTVEQLFVIPPPKVAEMLGIDNDSAVELFKKARSVYDDTPDFQSGLEAKNEDDELEKISTHLLVELLNDQELMVRRLGLRISELTDMEGQSEITSYF